VFVHCSFKLGGGFQCLFTFASRSEGSVQGNFLGRVGVLSGGLELRDEIRRWTSIMWCLV
jgi:hypothetical protein